MSQKEGEPGPGAIPRIKLVLLGDSVRIWAFLHPDRKGLLLASSMMLPMGVHAHVAVAELEVEMQAEALE